MVGNMTLIYNEFPRSAWCDGEVTIRQSEVQTDIFEKIPFFLVRSLLGQKMGLFCGRNQPYCRFKPIASGGGES